MVVGGMVLALPAIGPSAGGDQHNLKPGVASGPASTAYAVEDIVQ
jgi:hypothetical protein